MPPVEMLEELSNMYNMTINELLSGKKLSTEEYKEMAETNIKESLKASAFDLKEKQIFLKKKWRREHLATITACTAAWLVLLIALKLQGVETYLLGTIGGQLAVLYYVVLNNRMTAYVENIYMEENGTRIKTRMKRSKFDIFLCKEPDSLDFVEQIPRTHFYTRQPRKDNRRNHFRYPF